jgi:hypothetical protein
VEHEPRWEGTIETYFKEMYFDGVSKIYLGQYKCQWQSIMKTTMNFLVSQKVAELEGPLLVGHGGL